MIVSLLVWHDERFPTRTHDHGNHKEAQQDRLYWPQLRVSRTPASSHSDARLELVLDN